MIHIRSLALLFLIISAPVIAQDAAFIADTYEKRVYDIEMRDGVKLHTYKTIERNNPEAENMLVMGPWTHGGWAYPEFNNPSRIPFKEEDKHFFQNDIEYPFFSYYLKGKGTLDLPITEDWIEGKLKSEAIRCWSGGIFFAANTGKALKSPSPLCRAK